LIQQREALRWNEGGVEYIPWSFDTKDPNDIRSHSWGGFITVVIEKGFIDSKLIKGQHITNKQRGAAIRKCVKFGGGTPITVRRAVGQHGWEYEWPSQAQIETLADRYNEDSPPFTIKALMDEFKKAINKNDGLGEALAKCMTRRQA
jgi:hypothetical protein